MAEVRLIDANAAADEIMHQIEIHVDGIGMTEGTIMIAFARMMRDKTIFPTIEAEPVRHGQWICKYSQTARCPCCGWWQHTTSMHLPDDIAAFSKCYRFCTACGTKMDGGSENE